MLEDARDDLSAAVCRSSGGAGNGSAELLVPDVVLDMQHVGPHVQPPAPEPPGGVTASRPAGRSLRVVSDAGEVDVAAAERAVAALLVALGQDPQHEHSRDTPRRVAAAYAEMLTPRPFNVTTFPNDEGYDELIVARDISFNSLCQHHMLPFKGVAHVGYLPGARIVGLSKLARVVELFSRRLQVQERLTKQVAGWLQDQLDPRGVGVVIEAEHLCMSLRGVEASGTHTITSAVHGLLRSDQRSRSEFFALVGTRP